MLEFRENWRNGAVAEQRIGTKRNKQEQRGGNREPRITQGKYFSAVEPVRDVPRHQKQQHSWQKLHQPRQSQVQRPPGNLVDLPAHGHRLHLRAKDDAKSCYLVEAESTELECGRA